MYKAYINIPASCHHARRYVHHWVSPAPVENVYMKILLNAVTRTLECSPNCTQCKFIQDTLNTGIGSDREKEKAGQDDDDIQYALKPPAE